MIYQPDVRVEGTSHDPHWWKLVEDFVTHFNEDRIQILSPSALICSDESILWWYGQGSHWINLVLPIYVAMDRNPENGEDIHNYACGRSGIMMRIRIVKSENNWEEQQDDIDNLPHGKKVLKELEILWDNVDKIIFTDSYFASMPADLKKLNHGLRVAVLIKPTKRSP